MTATPDPQVEIEIKLQVPSGQRQAVQAAVALASAARSHLRALYFDTADRRLAEAGIALRLRLEGTRWVQTLKCGAPHGLARLEHNHPLPPRSPRDARTGAPALDLQRHDGTPAGRALAKALRGVDPGTLQVWFATDIWRHHRTLNLPGGRVELALDQGRLTAGGRQLAVCELEIELLNGPTTLVTTAAARWVRQHGLRLDVRSKAERGDRLARELAIGPAVKARPPVLRPEQGLATAWATVLQACLAQALPNASEIASGDFAAEHVHQCRVGLRRLRAAQRLFAGAVAPLPPAAVAALDTLFQQLGQARDQDVLAGGLGRELAAAGAPAPVATALAAEPPTGPSITEGTRAEAVNLAWLELLALAHATPAAQVEDTPSLQAWVMPRLQRWHRQVWRAGRRFDTLSDDERHRLRKRMKRLRYALEFCRALLPGKHAARYLKAMAQAQEALGAYNDLVTAQARFQRATEHDVQAWFALGWLAARRPALLNDCTRSLAAWRRVKSPLPGPAEPKTVDGGAATATTMGLP